MGVEAAGVSGTDVFALGDEAFVVAGRHEIGDLPFDLGERFVHAGPLGLGVVFGDVPGVDNERDVHLIRMFADPLHLGSEDALIIVAGGHHDQAERRVLLRRHRLSCRKVTYGPDQDSPDQYQSRTAHCLRHGSVSR